ncbi:MAG: methyltransferase [Acidimicrobiales bacterium]
MPDTRTTLRAMALWAKTDLVTPMAIRAMATLRLADHIAGGVTSIDELATVTHTDPDALSRLVRFLTTDGILVAAGPDDADVALGELGELLRSDHPDGLRGWFDLEGWGGRLDRTVTDLLDVVRSGEPAYTRVHGRSVWDDFAANPGVAASFARLMEDQATTTAPHIVAGYDWSSTSSVVDVGGGTGVTAVWLAKAVPELTITVVELPETAATATKRFADMGLADRCAAIVGSAFDPLPGGADAYLLARVIHDWPDVDAVRILSRCRDAAGETGRVLIIDGLMTDRTRRGLAAMDLQMLALFGGRERTIADYEDITTAAGLRIAGVEELPVWGRAIIECAAS